MKGVLTSVDALGRIVAKYKVAMGDGLQTRLLDQLPDLLPDPRAFDFLLGSSKTTGEEALWIACSS